MHTDTDSAALQGAVESLKLVGTFWIDAGAAVDEALMRTVHGLEGLLDGAAATPDRIRLGRAAHQAAREVQLARLDPWADVRIVIANQGNAIRSTLGAAKCESGHWKRLRQKVRKPKRDGPLTMDVPDDNATVEDIHAWWTTLDDDTRVAVIERHGQLLGRIDGIPVPARDTCNRDELDDAITATQLEIEDLETKSRHRRALLLRSLHRKRGKLEGLTTIRDRIAALEAEDREVFLIDLDTRGTGTATIAIENPDTADRKVSYLPGGGTTLNKVGGCLDDSTNLLKMIERLDYGEKPKLKTSMITRIYPVPEVFVGVVLADHAAEEAARLCRFQHGLHVTHQGSDEDVLYNVVTHSYGGVTGTKADLLYGLHANRIAYNGLPGAVADTVDDVSIAEVYATAKGHDLLAALSRPRLIHNRHPLDPKFGALIFTSDPGRRWPLPGGWSVSAHFDYFRTDGLSLYNNAQVCRGHTPIPPVEKILAEPIPPVEEDARA